MVNSAQFYVKAIILNYEQDSFVRFDEYFQSSVHYLSFKNFDFIGFDRPVDVLTKLSANETTYNHWYQWFLANIGIKTHWFQWVLLNTGYNCKQWIHFPNFSQLFSTIVFSGFLILLGRVNLIAQQKHLQQSSKEIRWVLHLKWFFVNFGEKLFIPNFKKNFSI